MLRRDPGRTGWRPTPEHPCPKLCTSSLLRRKEKSDVRQNGTEIINEHSGALMAAASSSLATRAIITIKLCEGIADALAIHHQKPGAVIACLTTFTKLISHHSLIKHIAAHNPVIFPDMDKAGKDSTDKLAQALT